MSMNPNKNKAPNENMKAKKYSRAMGIFFRASCLFSFHHFCVEVCLYHNNWPG